MLNIKEWFKPHFVFLSLALVIGTSYICFLPPFQTPDEFQHFRRAWQVSHGQFLCLKENNRVGGYLSKSIFDFEKPFDEMACWKNVRISKEKWKEVWNIKESDEQLFIDFPSVASYSPVSYLPQALTMCVFRIFGSSILMSFYAAKIAVFLLWALTMFYVIKIIPIGKWLIAAASLLPMPLSHSATMSADTMTNILSFLLLALALKLALSDEVLKPKHILIFFLLLVLLALAKVVYVALGLLLFIIPKEKFGSLKQKSIAIQLPLFAAVLVAILWTKVAAGYYLSYNEYNPEFVFYANINKNANYYEQKAFLTTNPFRALSVVYNTLTWNEEFYIKSYVGFFGRFLELSLPDWLWEGAIGLLLLVAVAEGANVHISYKHKLFFFCAFLIPAAGIVLSQYLIWAPPGADGVEYIQGRYFTPLAPLIFFLLYNHRFKFRNYLPFLIIPVVLLINAVALWLVYDRYLG